MKSVNAVALLTLALWMCGAPVMAQSRYSDQQLAVKQRFSKLELEAVAQDFVGVRTSAGIQTGLFPIHATGASTQAAVTAASAFLTSLTPSQLIKTQFSVNDPEWRRWFNIDNGIYVRQGTSLEEMNAAQKAAAWNLIKASLSAKGLELGKNIMKTDQTLRELNNDVVSYGEEKYFFTVMGNPSGKEPWGWQLDGHHLVLNFFFLGDQVVASPLFLGGEPIITESGKYRGNSILQEQQNNGVEFFRSLAESQRNLALLEPTKTSDRNKAEALQDNLVLDYQGVPGSKLNAAQKERLLALINLYIGTMDEPHAKIKLQEVLAHIDETYFAWIGGFGAADVFYYRIHSPVVLIEFDHQNPVGNPALPANIPTRQHIHTVVRTPNGNDYGKDLLRQHLLSQPH